MALRRWMLANIADDERGAAADDEDQPVAGGATIEEQHRWLGIDPTWLRFLALPACDVVRLKRVTDEVARQRRAEVVHPPADDVHRWSRLCSPEQTRVVILGQDPYHNGTANGVAFSTTNDYPPPPSLRVIFRELETSMTQFYPPNHGCLDAWCGEGVLLLNTVFTVLDGRPGSHQHLGWERLTQRILRRLSSERQHLVFMLWGQQAQEYAYLLDRSRHLILTSAHPSPLARNAKHPFLGNNHFVLANRYLRAHGSPEIRWHVITRHSPFIPS